MVSIFLFGRPPLLVRARSELDDPTYFALGQIERAQMRAEVRVCRSSFSHAWVIDRMFPSGSLNHATLAPLGDFQIPFAS